MGRSPLSRVRRILRIPGSARAQAAADVEREIAFHMEMRTDELLGQGTQEAEARAIAAREFGDGTRMRSRLKRESARTYRRKRLGDLVLGQRLDLRFALRRLRREPGFTAVAGSTLSIGIGATTAIFAVLSAVLLRPLPFEAADDLVAVSHTAPGFGIEDVPQATGTYFTYREDARSFEDLAVWLPGRYTITGRAEPEEVPGLQVTEAFFPLLRIGPVLGRAFGAGDVSPGAPPTALLGHSLWVERFGRSGDALGRTITADGLEYEVIGVLPAGFRFLDHEPRIVIPFQFDRARARVTDFSYRGLARLSPGASPEAATTELVRLLPLSTERFPRGLTREMLQQAGMRPIVGPLKDEWLGDVRAILWILFGTVGVVLAIACANVAGLFLVRAERRQRELAVQRALGASRARSARTYVIESLAFGLLAGGVGLVLAAGGVRLLAAAGPAGLPRLDEIRVGLDTALFALGVSGGCGALLGAIPLFRLRRDSLSIALREGGRASSDSGARGRARDALVVAQMALALVLLIGSGLMYRSFDAFRRVDPGFERDAAMLTFRIAFPPAQVPDVARVVDQHEAIERALEAIPGVERAAFVTRLPMEDAQAPEDALFVEGLPVPEGQLPPIRRFKWVSGDYVETMGIPLLAGRAITWDDIRARAPVVMVSRSLALEHWDDPRAAIGKRVRNESGDDDAPWREIVGVVADVRDDGLDRDPVPLVYWPAAVERFWGQELFAQRSAVFIVRTARAGQAGLVRQARDAVWSVNPNLPLAGVRTLDEVLRASMTRTSFTTLVLALAAAVALFLGAVGLYAVISYAVSTRTREIGVRMALGADHADVTRMVLRDGLVLALAGIVAGLGLALALTRLLEAVLFGVRATDPLTYGVTAVLLVTIAALASYLPARRASRVDPMIALRHE